MNMPN